MKKTLLIVMAIFPLLGSAQNNSVKLTLTPAMVLTNNFGINYERKFTDYFSANLRVNISSKKAVPFNGLATNLLGDILDSAGINSDVLNTKFISYGGSLQLRFFPAKEALKGFYVAPYFGFQAGKMNPFTFDFPDGNDPSIKHGGEVNASFLFLGGGLGIGNQWVTDSGFTLDVLWLGLGVGTNSILLRGEDYSNGSVDYAKVNGEVTTFVTEQKDIIDQLRMDVSSTYDASSIDIIAKHAFPYVKILNISLGYSF